MKVDPSRLISRNLKENLKLATSYCKNMLNLHTVWTKIRILQMCQDPYYFFIPR